MLREIIPVSQKPGEPRRRWFSSDDMDLFIWMNDQDDIISYHLSYDKPHSEKAVTWEKDQGFSHVSVDDGSRPGRYPASPLLKPDDNFKVGKFLSIFKSRSRNLDLLIQDFIVGGIEKYYGKQD